MKKIFSILLLFACSFAHSQIGQFSPIWTYTGSNIQYTNGATLTSSLGVGALPTSSLSAFQLVKGTGSVNIGEVTSGFPAIWFDTPLSTSNYALRGNGANTSINSVQRQQHNINNSTKGVWTSTGLRVGSSSDPSAVLDVTGTMSVSGSATIGTGQNNYMGSIISSQLESTGNAYMDTKLRVGGITTPTANLDVTGTMSVSSSATVTGMLATNTIQPSSGQLRLYSGTNSDLILRAVGASQVITSEINGSPKFQVNSSGATVTGSLFTTGSFSLGSANITEGNSGVNAVLSDITVPYQFAPNTALNPADLDIRYCGVLMPNYSALPTATGAIGFYVNDNIEVVRYDITVWNNGTVGSAESITVSLVSGSSSTLGLLNNTITSNSQAQTTSTCSINVNAGTRILIEYKFPTYATNPTSVWFNTVLYTRRRQ